MNLSTTTALIAGLGLAGSAFAQFSVDPAQNYLVGTQPSGMAAGDFDGDGDIDLATTVDGPDRVVTLLNDGAGSYTLGPAALLGASTSAQDCKAGDFNGDGLADLAVAVRDPQGAVVILTSLGAGHFSITATVATGDRPRGLTVGDHDNDGDMDIAVANRDSNSASVLTNNGGAFSAATYPVGGETRDTAFGDFDGDGDGDLAVTNSDQRSVHIFTNTGGVFAMTATLSTGPFVRPEGVDAADLDGDGDMDLAVSTSDDTFAIYQASIFRNAGGVFSGPTNYPTGGINPGDIVAADLDCNGTMDLAVVNEDSGTIALLSNTGAAAFGAPMLVATGATPSDIGVADFDGDGDKDIAVANRDSNNVSVLMNQTCAAGTPGDVDGDGDVDFQDLTQLLASWGLCGGCPADFDGDGDVDFSDLTTLLAGWTG